MRQLLKIVFKNKVLIYLISRYATYAIQFLNSIVIAVVLGPLYLAIWGFINLVLQYASQLNLGIPYSLNVLLSINKNDDKRTAYLMNAGLVLCSVLFVVLFVLFVLFNLKGVSWMDKYSFSAYAFPVFAIAILAHYNSLFTNYYRVKNRLNEIIFFQSVIPVTTFFALILVKDKQILLNVLLAIMFLGQFFSLLFFLRKYELGMTFKTQPYLKNIRLILKRGIYLFVYNTCFYLIMLSTRTLVSADYAVEEFGFFTFSFTLANTIMLLFDSFSFLIYPKTINRLNRADKSEVVRILNLIRLNYITSVHLVMYLFIILFPFIIKLFTQYDSVFKSFGLMAMTIILYSNCFAFSSFLTANGRERLLSVLAFITLVINILLALFISRVAQLDYSYVILATMVSYVIYNILLSYFSFRIIGISCSCWNMLYDNFAPRLFIPFLISLFLISFNVATYGFVLLFLLFLVLNRKQLYGIKDIICKIIYNPSIINI